MTERIRPDAYLRKWWREHPFDETTVMKCEACGLFYKPELGHKCKEDGKDDRHDNQSQQRFGDN